jgi:dihydrofolate reductase
MRIVVSEFISLDGVVQAPGGAEEDTDGGFAHGGWSMPFFDPEIMGAVIGDALSNTETLLFGRRTWRVMADAWPNRAGDPFADRMNSIEKYVVSSTLTEDQVDWTNSHLIPARDAVAAIRRLKERPGGDMQVMGSLSLTRMLIANDLVDQLMLMIEPILLGGGKSPFPDDGVARPFELVSTTTAKTGVQIAVYKPAGK